MVQVFGPFLRKRNKKTFVVTSNFSSLNKKKKKSIIKVSVFTGDIYGKFTTGAVLGGCSVHRSVLPLCRITGAVQLKMVSECVQPNSLYKFNGVGCKERGLATSIKFRTPA